MRSIMMTGLCSVAIASSAHAGVLTGVTDFAQDRLTWNNFCAPTTGADVAYYYSQIFSSLTPGNTSGDADTVIADMATRMGTTNSGGTTVNGLVAGLDSYLEDNWDSITGGTHWNTTYLSGASLGGAGLYSAVDSAINSGDGVILLLRTGWSRHWPDAEAYLGTAMRGPDAVPLLHFPGLDPEAARWLVENRAIGAIGIDSPSIDFGQSTLFETHQILYGENIPGFENVANLEAMPETGAYVIALPMKISGGSGGPLRIVGVVPGR